jgi:hypothetical protein
MLNGECDDYGAHAVALRGECDDCELTEWRLTNKQDECELTWWRFLMKEDECRRMSQRPWHDQGGWADRRRRSVARPAMTACSRGSAPGRGRRLGTHETALSHGCVRRRALGDKTDDCEQVGS